MKDQKTNFYRIYLPVILFFVAIIPRLLYLRDLHGTVYFDHFIMDSEAYHRSALNILNGLWTASRIFYLGPLYAFFLAGVYFIFGINFLAVLLVQFSLGAVSAVLIYALGRRFFNPAVGAIASLLYAFYGVFLFYEGQLLATSTAVFSTLLLIFIISKEGEAGFLRWLSGGVVLGLAILLRPNNLILFPFLLFWLLALRPDPLKRRIHAGIFFCLGTALIISPVTLRNYLADGDLLLVTPNGGINFYIGNNPEAEGTFSHVEGVALDLEGQARDAARVAEETLGRPLKPSEVSGFWMKKGRAFILNHPGRAVKLFGTKFFLFCNKRETRLNLDFNFHRRFSPMLGWPVSSFGFIFPFAIAGLVLSLNRWKALFPAHSAILASLLTVVLFFMSDRYRLPAVPFLLIFAVSGVWQLVSFSVRKQWVHAILGAILVSGGFLLAFRPLPGEVPNVSSYFNLGMIYEKSGLIHKAVAAYEKAILINTVTKADAVVVGQCLSIGVMGHGAEKGGALADFRIREVLKGRVAKPGVYLPCRVTSGLPGLWNDRERLPYFRQGEQSLLFLKKRSEGQFFVMGGDYGRYPLVRDEGGAWLASVYLPLHGIQSGLPDTRPAIPLEALKWIIREILETGDFRDYPEYVDASLSKQEVRDLREKRKREEKATEGRDFWND